MLASTFKSTSTRLASSSSQLVRSLSTSTHLCAPPPAQEYTENSHERQSRPRKAGLSKVREDAGQTASLLSAAVQSTQQHRDTIVNRGRSSADGSPRRRVGINPEGLRKDGQTGPRAREATAQSSRSSELGGQLVSRRKQSGGLYDADASAIASAPVDLSAELASSAETPSSSSGNPRQNNRRADYIKSRSSPSDPSSPNSKPRRSPSSSTGGPRSPRPPRKPRTSTPISFTPPPAALTPPSKVHYPSADLASLIQADLASHAAALRADIGHSGQEAEGEQAVRLKARKELRGDYSRWTAEGKETKGKGGEVVQRAAEVLAGNPSVSLEGRDFLLEKVQGLLRK